MQQLVQQQAPILDLLLDSVIVVAADTTSSYAKLRKFRFHTCYNVVGMVIEPGFRLDRKLRWGAACKELGGGRWEIAFYPFKSQSGYGSHYGYSRMTLMTTEPPLGRITDISEEEAIKLSIYLQSFKWGEDSVYMFEGFHGALSVPSCVSLTVDDYLWLKRNLGPD